jgi:hypothetical protein
VYRNVSMEDRFRYDCSGKWFKGNLHMHTTLSDGRLDVPAAAAYSEQRGLQQQAYNSIDFNPFV